MEVYKDSNNHDFNKRTPRSIKAFKRHDLDIDKENIPPPNSPGAKSYKTRRALMMLHPDSSTSGSPLSMKKSSRTPLKEIEMEIEDKIVGSPMSKAKGIIKKRLVLKEEEEDVESKETTVVKGPVEVKQSSDKTVSVTSSMVEVSPSPTSTIPIASSSSTSKHVPYVILTSQLAPTKSTPLPSSQNQRVEQIKQAANKRTPGTKKMILMR